MCFGSKFLMWLRLLGSKLCRQWSGNVTDRKSLAVSIKLSTLSIWVTRRRRLALRDNLLIQFLSVSLSKMCPAKAGRA